MIDCHGLMDELRSVALEDEQYWSLAIKSHWGTHGMRILARHAHCSLCCISQPYWQLTLPTCFLSFKKEA